jgi:hypothetical protein
MKKNYKKKLKNELSFWNKIIRFTNVKIDCKLWYKKWFNETLNLKPYQQTTKEIKLHCGSISNTKPNQLSIKE